MRVLRVISSMDPSNGGPAQGIRNSIPAMKALGCENEVVCLDRTEASYLGTDTFPVHSLGKARGPWSYHAALVPWLRANVHRFDCVILHGLWLYPGYAVRKVLTERTAGKRPPYFVFPHGMLDPWFQKAPERRLKAIRNWFHWKLVEHRIVRDAEGVLFTCEEELRLARTTFRPYKIKREINVGYGVGESPPASAKMRAAFEEMCPELKGRKYMLFLSRIHQKKGVDLLLNAYAEVAREFEQGTSKVDTFLPVLVIAGPGLDSPYGAAMKKLADETCPGGSVLWPGMLSGDAKWGAFHGCEAFVLPSHQENFGIAIVEALACAKPVLITHQVNIWREIQQENAGFVSADDRAGIKRLLESFMQLSVDQHKNVSSNALLCYKKFFTIALAAGKLVCSISAPPQVTLPDQSLLVPH